MDFLDYRESLGIGFCDEEKFKFFLANVYNALDVIAKDYYAETIDADEYLSFCNLTGTTVNYDALCDPHSCRARYEHCLSILDRNQKTLNDFLSYYIAFVNSVGVKNEDKNTWGREFFIDVLTTALNTAHIQFEVLTDKDEYFVFPRGASELDDTLVSQPLEWLIYYPKAHKTFCTALRQYSDGIYIRDVADNLRKTLEAFFQEFLGNDKNLETNKKEICKYLGSQKIDPGISGMFQPLINTYKNVNDRIAKHNDKIDKKLLEFLLYQTGVFIRMVIVVKQAEQEGSASAD